MEEWHQKLHNNTSPDDVVICEVGQLLAVADPKPYPTRWWNLAKPRRPGSFVKPRGTMEMVLYGGSSVCAVCTQPA